MLSFNNDNYHDLLSVRKFEDTKGIVKSRHSNKDRQYNGQ